MPKFRRTQRDAVHAQLEAAESSLKNFADALREERTHPDNPRAAKLRLPGHGAPGYLCAGSWDLPAEITRATKGTCRLCGEEHTLYNFADTHPAYKP